MVVTLVCLSKILFISHKSNIVYIQQATFELFLRVEKVELIKKNIFLLYFMKYFTHRFHIDI